MYVCNINIHRDNSVYIRRVVHTINLLTYMEDGLPPPTSTIVCKDYVICCVEDDDHLLNDVEDALFQIGQRYRRTLDKFRHPTIVLSVPYTTKTNKWCRELQKTIAANVKIEIIELYTNCDSTLVVQLKSAD